MSDNLIKKTLTKYLYIIFNERYVSPINNGFIERYVAKHPLLRPELIVVNDQLHGFKTISQKVASLESFPIYLELEGIIEEDNVSFMDSIELYTETQLNCQDQLNEMIYVSKLFSNFITFDRMINIASPLNETILIRSKIQDVLLQMTDDIDVKDVLIEFSQFDSLLRMHLRFFLEFIKICHALLIEKVSLDIIKKDIEVFFKKENL